MDWQQEADMSHRAGLPAGDLPTNLTLAVLHRSQEENQRIEILDRSQIRHRNLTLRKWH